MTEVRDLFPQIEKLDTPALHTRMEELRSSAPGGNFRELSDEALSELLCITRALRKRAASPGSSGPRAKRPAKTAASSLESLA